MAEQAVIRLSDLEASFDGTRWTCKDALMQDHLNTFFLATDEDWSPSVPNLLLWVARRAAEALGGEVMSYPPTEAEEGRIY